MTPRQTSKKVVIIGATSGIGREIAMHYLNEKDTTIVGITGRRSEKLAEIQRMFPDRVFYRTMDATEPESIRALDALIAETGGMDVMVYCAGTGTQNDDKMLDPKTEMTTVALNTMAFTRFVIHAYNYFELSGGGHIAAIASIAGVRPMRQAPSYSATKRYQTHYISCLAQKANKAKNGIRFTTVMPGFIATDLLKRKYPMTVSLDKGARLIFKAIEKQKRIAIVPGRWRWVVFFWRLLPFWEKGW